MTSNGFVWYLISMDQMEIRARFVERRKRALRLGSALGQYLPFPLARRLARLHPRLGYLLTDKPEFVHTTYLGDVSVWIDVKISIERELLCNTYEKAIVDWIRANVKAGATVLDVGANVGAISFALAKAVGASGKVLAFEPGPKFFERLQRNLALNPELSKRVECHRLGLSKEPGELVWSEDPELPGNAWLLSSPLGLRVPVARLDDFLKTRPLERLDFVKIDVEGMELDVLEGARETLERFRPKILVETLMHFEAVRKAPVRKSLETFLRSLGYRMLALESDGRLRPVAYPNFTATTIAEPLDV